MASERVAFGEDRSIEARYRTRFDRAPNGIVYADADDAVVRHDRLDAPGPHSA